MSSAKGQKYIAALKSYLASVKNLPVRGNKVLIKIVVEQIAKTTGIKVPTQALYKNPEYRELINNKCEKQGIEGIIKRPELKDGNEEPATQKLRKYLDANNDMPERNGKINITQLSKQSGLKRSDLYRGKCRDLVNDACEAQGIKGIEFREDQESRINDRVKMQLERENSNLKRKNASLYAEVQDLRRQVRRLEKVEGMMKKGRQFITELSKQSVQKKSDSYRGKCRHLVNDAREAQGIKGIELREDQEMMLLKRENSNLKRKNASLYAEVQDLRKQVRRLEKFEGMIKKGRQIIL